MSIIGISYRGPPPRPITLRQAQTLHGTVCESLVEANDKHGGKLLHGAGRWEGLVNKTSFARQKLRVLFHYNTQWGWCGGQVVNKDTLPQDCRCTIRVETEQDGQVFRQDVGKQTLSPETYGVTWYIVDPSEY